MTETTTPIPHPQGEVEKVIERVLQDVADLPDRTSPDDWPEAMLVTGEELSAILQEALTTYAEDNERDRLPKGHVILEQADNLEGTVSQTVRRPDGSEYERRVDALEAYGEQE